MSNFRGSHHGRGDKRKGRGDKTKRTVTGSFTFVQDDDKAKTGVTNAKAGVTKEAGNDNAFSKFGV